MIKELLKKAYIREGKIFLDGKLVEADLLQLSVLNLDPEETEFGSDSFKEFTKRTIKCGIPKECNAYVLGLSFNKTNYGDNPVGKMIQVGFDRYFLILYLKIKN